jgi:hypothetical protein
MRRRVQAEWADEAGCRRGVGRRTASMGEDEADHWHGVGSRRRRLTDITTEEGDWPVSRPGKEDRRLSSPVPTRTTLA